MEVMEDKDFANSEKLRLASDIVAAYLSNNAVDSDKIPEIVRSVYGALDSVANADGGLPATKQKPAVTVRKSITPDYLICLEDGKKLKMLKRYLRSQYDMTPEDYRKKWDLPADYPMVAPNYAQKRSQFAKQIGLGRSKAAASRKTTAKRATGRGKR